ncbi:hypothetical protein T265_08368 [Opisthorchis viverrini]|uniref:Uncharacterized protein n=1 Tax=Opisthorchis viverrini TaxID=6198 RepID=A0A074ZDW0_OPIVI|nr:hypothetical protein T265_08368 [Opisthorchis viverrini]KER23822.1 hypothetical protein T265_08368 [Opisthorchis viverrini]
MYAQPYIPHHLEVMVITPQRAFSGSVRSSDLRKAESLTDKAPWPQSFEDRHGWTFLKDFEEVAEAAGLETDRRKLTVLKTLLGEGVGGGGPGCGQKKRSEDRLGRRRGSPCSGPPGGYVAVQDGQDGTWI